MPAAGGAAPSALGTKKGDSSAKLIFGNEELVSQLLRNYSGLEILKDVQAEEFMIDDAELILTAYGVCGRIAKSVVRNKFFQKNP